MNRRFSGSDAVVFVLLLAGFTALAIAYWMLTFQWLGILLPVGFLAGTLLHRSDTHR